VLILPEIADWFVFSDFEEMSGNFESFRFLGHLPNDGENTLLT
jgi:hypothetical protein